MKKLFLAVPIFLFLAMSTLSYAGIDYIQYRENFEQQESPQAPLQHKSSVKRNEDSPSVSSGTNCNNQLYHKTHKHKDHKYNSSKKCNL